VFLGTLAGSLLAAPLAAEAQKSEKMACWRIGCGFKSRARNHLQANYRSVAFSFGIQA